MTYERNEASDAVLAELSRQALVHAAERLDLDPVELAHGLGRGRIADLILELKLARYWAYPRDRDRIEALLEGIDRRFAVPPSAAETTGRRLAAEPSTGRLSRAALAQEDQGRHESL